MEIPSRAQIIGQLDRWAALNTVSQNAIFYTKGEENNNVFVEYEVDDA